MSELNHRRQSIRISETASSVAPPTQAGSAPVATTASKSIVESAPGSIPDYSGLDYIELNGGKPCFNEWDLANIEGEHYSDLDYATGRNWLKK